MKFYRSGFAGKSVRRVAEYLTPSITNIVKYVFSEMEYVPQGWYPIKGWNDESVVDAQEKHWPTLLRNLQGPGPLGVSHLPWHTTREDRADHNIMMSYGYVLALAARRKDRLSILDWGGGVGHYYLYSKALLPEVEIEYDCYDVPGLCRLGRKLLPEIHLHDDERDFFGRQYDVVISSSSLHYFENWREQVRKLADATRGFLYVSRLQAVNLCAVVCRSAQGVSRGLSRVPKLVYQPSGILELRRGIRVGTGKGVRFHGTMDHKRRSGEGRMSRVFASPAACSTKASVDGPSSAGQHWQHSLSMPHTAEEMSGSEKGSDLSQLGQAGWRF